MLEQFEFKLEKNIIAIQKDAGKNREVLSKQRKKRASLVTFDHGKLNVQHIISIHMSLGSET